MKIATFNVNNLNKRLVNLLDWLRASRPDVACLQELKATDSQFGPVTAPSGAGKNHGMASRYLRAIADQF